MQYSAIYSKIKNPFVNNGLVAVTHKRDYLANSSVTV